jgi:hypothetical protein
MAANGSRNHLVLALGQKGFGEAILGLRLVSDLRNAGEDVVFLAHDSNAILLDKVPNQITFSTEAAPLLPLYIDSCIQDHKPSSIILSDYLTTTFFFNQPETLKSYGLPIIAIDTWDSGSTPHDIDVFVNLSRAVNTWPDMVKSIYPVPFLTSKSRPGVYQCLPERVELSRKVRHHLRRTLGLSDKSKAVLFCTAAWQQSHYESDVGMRMAATLPQRVADLILAQGEDVNLIHIGPKKYDLKTRLDGRYHWLPPLAPGRFDKIVASVDLVLTANISATTIAKAMVCQVPVLVLQNSVLAHTVQEAEAAMPAPPSEQLREWLDQALPIFPFSLWPVGYRRFLEPIMRDNPYVSALDVVELLDEKQVESALHALLFETAAREEQIHRQSDYLSYVRSMPSGTEAIQSALAS